uniref:NADH dehydrogenase subunit 1 n=1 Tax=Xyloplax princealberti TaxID=3083365 RepID=UPI002E7A3EE8
LNLIIIIFNSIFFIVPVLLAVAYLTLVERKVLGYIQTRNGPNVVGIYGVLQPLADGLKLLIKETLKPFNALSFLFYFCPVLFLGLALILWAVIPVSYANLNFNLSLILILGISSLSVYSLLGSGWASNSNYSFLGGVRAVAQTISYEISLGLILLGVIIYSGSFNINVINNSQNIIWLIFVCFPSFLIWFVSTLAETNRAPFDLTEGESEIVSGYNVEYAGGPFAIFFIAEYANIIFMNLFSCLLFLGGGSPVQDLFPLNIILVSVKTTFLIILFLWIRASYPRFRYDQLMYLTWKVYLPFSLGLLIFLSFMILSLNILPPGLWNN